MLSHLSTFYRRAVSGYLRLSIWSDSRSSPTPLAYYYFIALEAGKDKYSSAKASAPHETICKGHREMHAPLR